MANITSKDTIGSSELENLISIIGEYFSKVSGRSVLSAKGLLRRCIIEQLQKKNKQTVKDIESSSVQERMQFVKVVFGCFCRETNIDIIHIDRAIDIYVQWKRDNAR